MNPITTTQQQLYGLPPKKLKSNKAETRRVKEVQVLVRNGKVTWDIEQMTANKAGKETFKKPLNEQYRHVLWAWKTGEISLFWSKNYKVSVSIWLNFSRMPQDICVYDTGAVPDLIQADAIELSRLNSICQDNKPKIWCASDKKLTMSTAITLHLQIGETRTIVAFGIVDKYTVPVLLRAIFINKFIRSIHPAERKISHSTHHRYQAWRYMKSRAQMKRTSRIPANKFKNISHC